MRIFRCINFLLEMLLRHILRSHQPVSRYFWTRKFFFLPTASAHTYPANPDIFLNPLSRVEKNKFATNPIMCGRMNQAILKTDDAAYSCPVSYRKINQHSGTTATTRQICRHYSHASWRMLWTYFIAQEPWVLQWIRKPSDASGQANSIGYVWTRRKFFNPGRKICRFKNIRIRVDGA